MTVIAWDGKTLAADRLHDDSGLARACTKIHKHGDIMVAGAGAARSIQAMRDWIVGGMDKAKFPSEHLVEEAGYHSPVWVIYRSGTVVKFENSPYPTVIEDLVFTEGSGRDYALGAMAMGADAKTAVEVACRYDIRCGRGIDVLTFDD